MHELHGGGSDGATEQGAELCAELRAQRCAFKSTDSGTHDADTAANGHHERPADDSQR